MRGCNTALARLVGAFVCVLAASWGFPSNSLMAASKGAERGAVSAARLSGKLTLEFSSTHEDSGGAAMELGMGVDGKLRLQAGGGVSCDVTAGARPHPAGRGVLGYAAVALAARPGGGFRLDLDARTSRTSEADDAGDPADDRISRLIRAVLAWKSPSCRVSSKVAWEKEGVVFPCRPASDHERREVAGEVSVVPVAVMSALAGVSFVDREYRVAPYKSSATNVAWCEVGVDPAGNVEGKVRLEGKRAVYPGSPTRTYNQRKREVTLSWDPRPRLSIGLALSHVDKDFPFAREKDLLDREISASLSMGGTAVGTLTLEGTAFERKVPACAKNEYTGQSVGAELESSVGCNLSLSAGCVLSRRLHADPSERDDDYTEAEITWKMRYDLSRDTEITCEAQIERREYPLREARNTHRFTSGVTVVYRF